MESIWMHKDSAGPKSMPGRLSAQGVWLKALGLTALFLGLLTVTALLVRGAAGTDQTNGTALPSPFPDEVPVVAADASPRESVSGCLVEAVEEMETYNKRIAQRRGEARDARLGKWKNEVADEATPNWSQRIIHSASHAADVVALSLKECDDGMRGTA